MGSIPEHHFWDLSQFINPLTPIVQVLSDVSDTINQIKTSLYIFDLSLAITDLPLLENSISAIFIQSHAMNLFNAFMCLKNFLNGIAPLKISM